MGHRYSNFPHVSVLKLIIKKFWPTVKLLAVSKTFIPEESRPIPFRKNISWRGQKENKRRVQDQPVLQELVLGQALKLQRNPVLQKEEEEKEYKKKGEREWKERKREEKRRGS